MAKRPAIEANVLPSLTPHRSIELLRQRLNEFDQVSTLRRNDPELKKWMDTTAAILDGAFGKPNGRAHEMTYKFKYDGGVSSYGKSDQFYEQETPQADAPNKGCAGIVS